jgi:hypothetical protein
MYRLDLMILWISVLCTYLFDSGAILSGVDSTCFVIIIIVASLVHVVSIGEFGMGLLGEH